MKSGPPRVPPHGSKVRLRYGTEYRSLPTADVSERTQTSRDVLPPLLVIEVEYTT